jgi:hypothetical protein
MDIDGAAILAELQRPDDLTRRFSPLGLGGWLTPEDAAGFQTAVIASAVLADNVPDGIRENFARVRRLHQYGVLEYDFFTVAAEYSLLMLEGALRVRFLTYYEDGVPVLSPKGVEETLAAGHFDDVRAARSKGRSLRGADGRTAGTLPVSTSELFAWARRERLLPGTRTRFVDKALSNMRNYAAHPVSHTVIGPPDSSSQLRDVAEIINRLWGHDTHGGSLFGGPRERRPHVVVLSPERDRSIEMRIEQVSTISVEAREWSYAVFLAAEGEELVTFPIDFAHRPGVQNTWFPCEPLWKGSWPDLVREIESGAFDSSYDSVLHLDRLFFVREHEEGIDLARSREDMLALTSVPEGRWYAIVADSPFDAALHVRDHEAESSAKPETCPDCFVRILGRFDDPADALAFARERGVAPER